MTCRLCGSLHTAERFNAREVLFGLGGAYEYAVCGSCGAAQIVTIPDDLSPFYSAEYYSMQPPAPERWPVAALKRARNRYEVFGRGALGRLIDARTPNIYMRGVRVPGIRPGWRILDVGCGAGANTVELAALGFREVSGVDPNLAEDVRHAGGVRIRKASLDEMPGGWDIVYFHHSFEHVPDPAGAFAAAAARVKPGGWLVISCPVFPNAAFERYGADWAALDAPRHLFIPSERAMHLLADGNAMSLQSVQHNGNAYQFWASEQAKRGIPIAQPGGRLLRPAEGLFPPARMRRWARLAARWNREGRGDQAVFRFHRGASG